jgi:fatty acid desaturase
VIGLVVTVALRWWSLPVALVAMFVIATRQHGLFILFHDGVHSLVARPQRVNDFVINTAVGVPLLLPVHLYRAVHLAHHRDVGTDSDPERVLLYHKQPWKYRPLGLAPLAWQVAGDTLVWNNIVMAVRFFRARGDAQSTMRLASARAFPELAVQIAVFATLWGVGLWFAPQVAGRVALLWFVPYLTILQLLQKLRSFAEHAGEGEGDALTYSWSPGLVGRLTIWPYNINYHFEHHDRPGVPWDELPAMVPSRRRRPGRELPGLLWNGALR